MPWDSPENAFRRFCSVLVPANDAIFGLIFGFSVIKIEICMYGLDQLR
jgi:hypothetical protein